METGQALAAQRGAELEWHEADVEALPYAPPPPPGAQPPPLWGNEDHVRGLFGEQITDVVACRQTVTVDRFAAPDAFRDYFKTNYGPTELARRHDQGAGQLVMEWEYLLLTARKRG